MKTKKTAILLSLLLTACLMNVCGDKGSSETSSSADNSAASSVADGNSADDSESDQSNTQIGSSDEKASAQTTATEIRTDESGETYIAFITETSPDNQNSSADQPDDKPDKTQTEAKPVQSQNAEVRLEVETVKAKAGQEGVPVKVSISKNCGLNSGGITIDHPAAIKPLVTDADGSLDYELAAEWESAMTAATTNENNSVHRIAFAFFAQNGKSISTEGTLFTCYFDIPADAKPGTEYKLDIEPNMFQKENAEVSLIDAVDGAIIIE